VWGAGGGMDGLTDLGLVLLAMLLGGLVGLEREWAHKPAGLRTHMLVSGASALFVLLSYAVTRDMSLRMKDEAVSADPTRVILAIVTGISFIGAGTVIRQRGHDRPDGVVGLTTAASLLMASGVGVGIALEQYILSTGAVVLSVVTMYSLGIVEWRTRRLSAKGARRDSAGLDVDEER
jgi:putative Mg2+ transporter-C (MgtC) family protein